MRKKPLVITYFFFFISLVFVIFPFAWMFSSSFKPESEMMSIEPKWIPNNPTIKNYLWVLGISTETDERSAVSKTLGLKVFFKNSIIVSGFTCLIVWLFSILGGFSLARFSFRGKRFLGLLFLMTTFFPLVLMLVPFYIVLSRMRLIDTYTGLIFVMSATCTPFCVWMMKGFISSIPIELEECATVDGCTRIGAFLKITLPLIKSGSVATLAYTFITTWGAFIQPLIISTSDQTKQISIGLSELVGWYGQTNWGGLLAGSVTTALPVALAFMVFQKFLVQGMTLGAVKE